MNIGPATSSPSAMHHHQYASSAADMSRSTFPSSYYESFYANGAPSAWGAYPPPAATYSTQASTAVTSAAANSCLLGPSGPKSLVNSHFSTVHSQRRKRRVLFTQAQVLVPSSSLNDYSKCATRANDALNDQLLCSILFSLLTI